MYCVLHPRSDSESFFLEDNVKKKSDAMDMPLKHKVSSASSASSAAAAVSTLSCLLSGLQSLHWFGFPLLFKRKKKTGLIQAKFNRFEYFKLLLFLLLAIFPNWALYRAAASSPSPSDDAISATKELCFPGLRKMAEWLRFSYMDLVTSVILMAVAIVFNLATFAWLVASRNKLVQLFHHFESFTDKMDYHVESTLPSMALASYHRSRKKVLFVKLLAFASSLMQSAASTLICMAVAPAALASDPVLWLGLALVPVTNCFGMLGGNVCACDMMLYFFPSLAENIVRSFISDVHDLQAKLKTDIKNKDKILEDLAKQKIMCGVHSCLALGSSLCSLLSLTNDHLAVLFGLQFAQCVFGGALALYCSTGIIFHQWTLAISAYSVTFLLFAAHFWCRIHMSSKIGQTLDDSCKSASRALEELSCCLEEAFWTGPPTSTPTPTSAAGETNNNYNNNGVMSTTWQWWPLRSRIRQLAKQLSRSTPLRPGSYFSVGHSTQVAAISTVLTYLIVLVQFKESRT